jgi:uncharacterized membrane protein YoaK (UPF0700 family)
MIQPRILLAFVAGAVDTTTFLSLSGLFAAHVTGNFVLLAATLVVGHPRGVWSKVASVPMFIVGVLLASFAAEALQQRGRDVRRPLLAAELALLLVALAMAAVFGPFADADQPLPMTLAMILVTAMAIQNALGPLATPGEPSTTVMTTNVTRLFVDLAALMTRTDLDSDTRRTMRQQAVRIAEHCTAFLLGCAAGAAAHLLIDVWALAVPVVCVAWLLVLDLVQRAVR